MPEKLSEPSKKVKTPWKDGLYGNHKNTSMLIKVSGENIEIYNTSSYLEYPGVDPIGDGSWTYGDFGPANEAVKKASSGIENNNIEMKSFNGMLDNFGIVSEDGETINIIGMWDCLESIYWLSDEGKVIDSLGLI